jgi:hypothetical protein
MDADVVVEPEVGALCCRMGWLELICDSGGMGQVAELRKETYQDLSRYSSSGAEQW